MPDPAAPLLPAIDEQVRNGLPDHRDGLAEAQRNEDFYCCRNALYLERREGEDVKDYEARPKQFSRLARRAVRALTALMYAPGPARTLPDATADQLLKDAYKANRVDALWQSADRKATLSGLALFQAAATGLPDRPIRLTVLGREQFVPFWADDSDDLIAVIVKSVVSGKRPGTKRRRFEVWTAEKRRTYYGDDFTPAQAHAMEASWRTGAKPDGDWEANPYGVLPFSVVGHEPIAGNPAALRGIGSPLAEANQEVDRMLSDMAQLLEAYNRPQGFARFVASNWRYADKIGRFTPVPGVQDAVEMGHVPELFYLQPQVQVDQTWLHIDNFINATFEDLDVPLRAARGTADVQESGVAVAMKLAPMRYYVEARRPFFGDWEKGLAKLVLSIYLGYYGVGVAPAVADEMVIEWPPVRVMPGAEQDASDAYELSWGILSKIGLVMRRRGLTREQALEYLEQLAQDMTDEQSILGEALDAEAQAQGARQTAMFGEEQSPDGGDPDAESGSDAETE